MSESTFLETLLDGTEVEWKPLGEVFHIAAGGDKPKEAISDVETEVFRIPILSNGIEDKSLYGWTNRAKINQPSLTVSARGTIGWTSYRDRPFFPIIRLLVLTPKLGINLKYAYYFMKTIERGYKIPEAGIPQLTKPMIKGVQFPIPCPENPEKSLATQAEIVRILDTFTELTAELTARKKQYNYYRDQLLTFEEGDVEWKALGEIGEFIRGKRFTKADYVDDGIDVMHYGEIYTHYGVSASQAISQVRSDLENVLRYAESGDVVMASVGETIEEVGKAVAWLGNGRVAIHDDSYAFRHSMNAKYLSYYMQTAKFIAEKEKHVSRGKMKRLLINGVSKVRIPIPHPKNPEKSLAEQARIVAILDKFDTLTHSISKGLPREIGLRQKQYEYYRDLLLNFPKPEAQREIVA